MTMKKSHYVLKLELIKVTHEEGEKVTRESNWIDWKEKGKEKVNEDTTLFRTVFTEVEIDDVLHKGQTLLNLYTGE